MTVPVELRIGNISLTFNMHGSQEIAEQVAKNSCVQEDLVNGIQKNIAQGLRDQIYAALDTIEPLDGFSDQCQFKAVQPD